MFGTGTYYTPDPQSFPPGSVVSKGRTYGENVAQIGYDVYGKPLLLDISKQPHVLIAGASGSGKSSLMHAIILSLAAVAGNPSPSFIFIDVKRVEFSVYTSKNFPPAAYKKPASDIIEIKNVLTSVSREIEQRYRTMERHGQTFYTGPKKYIFIDELADLVIGHRDILQLLIHIGQIGRAAGVHVVAATQVPSRSTIPTLLQVNMPCHISLRVSSPVESRIILGDASATALHNPGDLIINYADGRSVVGHADYYSREDVVRILRTMTARRTFWSW